MITHDSAMIINRVITGVGDRAVSSSTDSAWHSNCADGTPNMSKKIPKSAV